MGFFTNSYVKNIMIGDNVQFKNNTMYNAFALCSSFNSPITIPNSVTNASNAFYACSNFNSPVTFGSGCKDISNAFRSCPNFNQPVTIPSSVTNCWYIFDGCTNFNQPVTISNGVPMTVGMFANCTKFNSSVTIPNSVTDARSMFYGCTNFSKNVEFPESVTQLHQAFEGCTNMSGNIIIRGRNIVSDSWAGSMPFYRLLVGKNNAKRVNIFVYNGSKTNNSLYSDSTAVTGVHGLVGNSFSWTKSTNYYYNSKYNIYVYHNLV